MDRMPTWVGIVFVFAVVAFAVVGTTTYLEWRERCLKRRSRPLVVRRRQVCAMLVKTPDGSVRVESVRVISDTRPDFASVHACDYSPSSLNRIYETEDEAERAHSAMIARCNHDWNHTDNRSSCTKCGLMITVEVNK